MQEMMPLHEIDEAELPDNPNFTAVKMLLGDTLALHFAYVFSGKRIYIPKTVSHNHKMCNAIGADALERLVRVYGGMETQVPISIGKKARVIELLNRKFTVPEVVEQMQVTRQFVYDVDKAYQKDGLNGLFDTPTDLDKNQLKLF